MALRTTAAISCLFVLSAVISPQHAHSATYDPATAFEGGFVARSNPNGVWSYGYSATPTSAVTLYNAQQSGADSPNEQFWIGTAVNCCIASPSVGYNNGPAFDDGNVAAGANQMILVSSVFQGLSTDLIFTAPTAGTYKVAGSFIGDQRSIGVGVDVVESSSSILFGSSVNAFGQVVPFSNTVALSAGDTIEFAVTQGDGNQNTGLVAAITSESSTIPEPTSLALLAMGLLGLVARRRHRLGLSE